MSISHRSNRLKLVGSPSVEKLQNGRYKLVVTCSTMNSREDWYSANKDRIFPDFGSLQSAEMSIDGLAPRTGEAYADMRLTQVESGNRSGMGQVGDYNVSLTYETLGSSFVQVKDDDTDYELNGLRSVSRTIIAEAGTDYAKTVGTSYIDHQIDDETAVRCFLASYGIDDTDSFRQVEEVYVEAGTLNVQRVSESDGVYRVTTTFLGVEGTVVGPIIARTEGDFEGLKTITVVSMQDASGASLINDTAPVASHSILNEFTYPGVVTISDETLSGTDGTYTFKAKDFSLMPPVASRVPATIKVSFKTTSTIAYTASGGLWNPDTWAEGFSKGIAWNYLPFSIARGFRGYRIDSSATAVNSYSAYGIPGTGNFWDMISGKRIFGSSLYQIAVSGGPPDPEGGTYTLDYSVSLAFEDTSGVAYYKHTEIVATIPSR